MTSRILTLTLAVALALSLFVLAPQLLALRLPGNNQGYEPPQPIAFSHLLHAGELQVQCLYCHSGAEKSRLDEVDKCEKDLADQTNVLGVVLNSCRYMSEDFGY